MKTQDSLVTCPDCGTANIYASKLAQHRTGKNCASRRAEKTPTDTKGTQEQGQKARAKAQEPGSLAAPARGRRIAVADLEVLAPARKGPVDPDAEMGRELTEQYHRATGGMVEVLKFGSMFLQIREQIDSARGVAKLGNDARRGTGFKAWLKEYAPEIKEPTAYRLASVVESVSEEYTRVVGTKIAKQYALPALVTTPAEQLPAPVAAKQMELFNFVRGTSQRSWLDRFTPAARKGGKTYERGTGKGDRNQVNPKVEGETPEEQASIALWKPLIAELELEGIKEKSWAHLPDKYLRQLKGAIVDLNKALPSK